MAKQPAEAPKLTIWDVYRAATKRRPLGTAEAASETEPIEKAAAEFKVIASKLTAVARR